MITTLVALRSQKSRSRRDTNIDTTARGDLVQLTDDDIDRVGGGIIPLPIFIPQPWPWPFPLPTPFPPRW